MTKLPLKIWDNCKLYGEEKTVKNIENEWNSTVRNDDGELKEDYYPVSDWESGQDDLKIDKRSDLYYETKHKTIDIECEDEEEAEHERTIIWERMRRLGYDKHFPLKVVKEDAKYYVQGYCTIGALIDIAKYVMLYFKGDLDEIALLVDIINQGQFYQYLPYLIRIGLEAGPNIVNAHAPVTYYLIAKNS